MIKIHICAAPPARHQISTTNNPPPLQTPTPNHPHTQQNRTMPLSESETTAMREQLERQEQYAQKLVTIQNKIRQVEAKFIDELTNIRSQLQEIVRACSEAEMFFDNISKKSEEPTVSREGLSDSKESEESPESEIMPGSESSSESEFGGMYFIIDDIEEYNRLVAYLIKEEMEEILAAWAAEAAGAAGHGEGSSGGAH
ncbi:hypothetical protein DL98DRAFT_272257 [Cadophora sp. DSE1049]|nr:hypothetical protein DL98DRAFT_272257 [Cadophora sp. DSE1049]